MYFKLIDFCWTNSKLNIFDFQLFMLLKNPFHFSELCPRLHIWCGYKQQVWVNDRHFDISQHGCNDGGALQAAAVSDASLGDYQHHFHDHIHSGSSNQNHRTSMALFPSSLECLRSNHCYIEHHRWVGLRFVVKFADGISAIIEKLVLMIIKKR